MCTLTIVIVKRNAVEKRRHQVYGQTRDREGNKNVTKHTEENNKEEKEADKALK